MKEAGHKKTRIVEFRLPEMSNTGKSTETEKRVHGRQGLGAGGQGCGTGARFPLGERERVAEIDSGGG